ncbi:MAG: hypothetical protein WBA83_16730 [Burkholderiaceae bacterium]
MSFITVNIDKAREIRKEQLRAERVSLLTALDIEFQRAIETGSDTLVIVAKKQLLRDITEQCDAPDITLEGLRAIACQAD